MSGTPNVRNGSIAASPLRVESGQTVIVSARPLAELRTATLAKAPKPTVAGWICLCAGIARGRRCITMGGQSPRSGQAEPLGCQCRATDSRSSRISREPRSRRRARPREPSRAIRLQATATPPPNRNTLQAWWEERNVRNGSIAARQLRVESGRSSPLGHNRYCRGSRRVSSISTPSS